MCTPQRCSLRFSFNLTNLPARCYNFFFRLAENFEFPASAAILLTIIAGIVVIWNILRASSSSPSPVRQLHTRSYCAALHSCQRTFLVIYTSAFVEELPSANRSRASDGIICRPCKCTLHKLSRYARAIHGPGH